MKNFDYISGANALEMKIPMTAPVIFRPSQEGVGWQVWMGEWQKETKEDACFSIMLDAPCIYVLIRAITHHHPNTSGVVLRAVQVRGHGGHPPAQGNKQKPLALLRLYSSLARSQLSTDTDNCV